MKHLEMCLQSNENHLLTHSRNENKSDFGAFYARQEGSSK